MHAIFAQQICKKYPKGPQALDEFSLEVQPGDFYALLGPNGAGKTSFISILSSLSNKDSGELSVFGENIDTARSKVKSFIGLVPQEFNCSIFEKVEDILIWQAGYFGIPSAQAKIRAEILLKDLGLWDKKDQIAKNLSGGMKRRLMIARALMHQPQLLILDEPTAGVDLELRLEMWEYLKKLNKEGTTILLTTHYLEEVERLCNKMAMIRNGKILASGNLQSFLEKIDTKTIAEGETRMEKLFLTLLKS